MITLQNNFTTPEESKRLLELGVPSDSADCYYDKDEVDIDEVVQPYFVPFNRKFSNYDERFYLPCWSVGRLIEILGVCCSYRHHLPVDYCTIKYIVSIIKNEIKLNRIDFSKLED